MSNGNLLELAEQLVNLSSSEQKQLEEILNAQDKSRSVTLHEQCENICLANVYHECIYLKKDRLCTNKDKCDHKTNMKRCGGSMPHEG